MKIKNLKLIIPALLTLVGKAVCVSNGPILYVSVDKFHSCDAFIYADKHVGQIDTNRIYSQAKRIEREIAEKYDASAIALFEDRHVAFVYLDPANDISDEVVAALNADFVQNRHLYIKG